MVEERQCVLGLLLSRDSAPLQVKEMIIMAGRIDKKFIKLFGLSPDPMRS